jgi:hypothetical protein
MLARRFRKVASRHHAFGVNVLTRFSLKVFGRRCVTRFRSLVDPNDDAPAKATDDGLAVARWCWTITHRWTQGFIVASSSPTRTIVIPPRRGRAPTTIIVVAGLRAAAPGRGLANERWGPGTGRCSAQTNRRAGTPRWRKIETSPRRRAGEAALAAEPLIGIGLRRRGGKYEKPSTVVTIAAIAGPERRSRCVRRGRGLSN